MTMTKRQTSERKPFDVKSFQSRLGAYLVERGGRLIEGPNSLGTMRWRVETTLGRMTISAHGDGLGVYCRFEHPRKAITVVDCNRHTGKYNTHFFGVQSTSEAMEDTRRHIGRFLPDPGSRLRSPKEDRRERLIHKLEHRIGLNETLAELHEERGETDRLAACQRSTEVASRRLAFVLSTTP